MTNKEAETIEPKEHWFFRKTRDFFVANEPIIPQHSTVAHLELIPMAEGLEEPHYPSVRSGEAVPSTIMLDFLREEEEPYRWIVSYSDNPDRIEVDFKDNYPRIVEYHRDRQGQLISYQLLANEAAQIYLELITHMLDHEATRQSLHKLYAAHPALENDIQDHTERRDAARKANEAGGLIAALEAHIRYLRAMAMLPPSPVHSLANTVPKVGKVSFNDSLRPEFS